MILLPNGLFDFQEKCVENVLSIISNSQCKQTIVIKAPTGAGKTILLIDLIDKYIDYYNQDTSFIWLCPGQGDLEEQSMRKAKALLPNKNIQDLDDALSFGFEPTTITFINWEKVTKKGNKAIIENERRNLFDRIAEAHRSGTNFIIIIDEEHSHDTSRASDIINAFSANRIIRVSATAKHNTLSEYYEIPEEEVINSGLITKALYINDGVTDGVQLSNEHEYLIDLADTKRKEIAHAYSSLGKAIRPLVIIQFPNSSQSLIEDVERLLEARGFTYSNGLVAKWMSEADAKINLSRIEDLNAQPVYLLMKQAISLGWDCPRAKILVKLRERMNEDFEIQTIGRIRRMPELRHYGNDSLDMCFLYTFDDKYKESIIKEISQAFEVRRLFLKDECKQLVLTKQNRDLDFDGLGERETLEVIYNFFREKYSLTSNKKDNQALLKTYGFIFGEMLIGRYRQGVFVTIRDLVNEESGEFISTQTLVNTHKNGIEFMHSVDLIKAAIGMQAQKVKTILERLFRDSVGSKYKIIKLGIKEFYAFVINNADLLKQVFREATTESIRAGNLNLNPKESEFRIPLQELYHMDPFDQDVKEIVSNAYSKYSTAMIVEGLRSNPERLFEMYCESSERVNWVYKNGNKGQQYFSIVYLDALSRQLLFYPDYILMTTDGKIWIIETKGGQSESGESRNIDDQVTNKFEAFKEYAEKHNLNWGFVRDRNLQLKINNTFYIDDMRNPNWISIESCF